MGVAYNNVLKAEINALFEDATVRIKFLEFFAQTKCLKNAYQYGVDLEMKNLFNNNVRWYDSLANIVLAYEKSEPGLDFDFYLRKIAVLDRRTNLSNDEHQIKSKNLTQCVSVLFAFDQALYSFSHMQVPNSEFEIFSELIKHFRAQLSFYLATLILKRAKEDCGIWHKAEQMAFPLLMCATQKTMSLDNALYREMCSKKKNTRDYKLWNTDAAFRVSQAGHVLRGLTQDNNYQLLEKFGQYCRNEWRSLVYQEIFNNGEYQQALETSYFMTDPSVDVVSASFLTEAQLDHFDKLSQLAYPDSLDHLVWLGLTHINEKDQLRGDFRCTVVSDLPFTVKDLSNTEPETLNQLDVDAFLYAAVLCAKNKTSDHGSITKESPCRLPVCISEYLCSPEQVEWWNGVYKMYTAQATGKILERRLTIRKGIETIRVFGRHGLDVKIVLFLAKLFEQRAAKNHNSDEIAGLQARINLYWTAAIFLLEKIEKKEDYSVIPNQFFDYSGRQLNDDEIKSYIKYGRLLLSCQSMEQRRDEKATEGFQLLKGLEAPFDHGLVFSEKIDDGGQKISACIEFAKFVRQTYGFFIKNKVVVKHIEKLLEKDPMNILPKSYPRPLIAKMLDAAMKQENDLEGGTNFVLIFCGSLLEAAQGLKKSGISPEDIINGFKKASKNSHEVLKKLFVNPKKRVGKCNEDNKLIEVKNFIKRKICCENDCENGLAINGKELFIRKKDGDLFNTGIILNEDDFRVLRNECSPLLTCSRALNLLSTYCTDPLNRIMSEQTRANVALYPVFNFSWISNEEDDDYCLLHNIMRKLSLITMHAVMTKDDGGKIIVTAGRTDSITVSCVNREKLMLITLENKSELLRLQHTIGGVFIEDALDFPDTEDREMGRVDSVFMEILNGEISLVIFRLYQQKIFKMNTLIFEDVTTTTTQASYDNTYEDDSFTSGVAEKLSQGLSLIGDEGSAVNSQIAIKAFTIALTNLVEDIVDHKSKGSIVSALEKSILFGLENSTLVAVEILNGDFHY